jgi:acetolactate synthase-1/2/3 large subunit
MQGVLLHAGAGLLQGAMGIHGAFVTGVPMVVISGESMTYGEQPEFDPGAQWINNLSIVGGTTALVDSIVKYSSVAGSAYTLYESVIRAGELAQRQPSGPTYLSVSTETLMDAWTPPANARTVPPAPRVLTAPEDIEKLAAQISKAKHPVVLTEGAGQEVDTYEALLALCEKFALPLVEKPGALFANFPKDHPLYQGTDIKPFWNEMDLAIVVRARVPWYPPSNRPPKAVIAMVDEAPHNSAMVYQSHQADMYLEGNAAQTLRDLAVTAKLDKAAVEGRRKELSAAHDALVEKRKSAQAASRKKTPIDPVWVCAALNAVMPKDSIYIDEVTTHTATLRQHLVWNQPQSLFSRQGGLGQGLGLSLGIKLGKPERQVATLIGDGAFLYNPVLGSLGAARDYKLPILIVIFNNKKYAAMQGMHQKMYPDGVAAEIDLYHGTHITAPDFVKVAQSVGGYGEQVTDPEKLQDALKRGLEANGSGNPAIIDVIVE